MSLNFLNEVNIDSIIEKWVNSEDNVEESFYICDVGDIYDKIKLWNKRLPRIKPYYAIKCNNESTILKFLSSLDIGFDCGSRDEIEKMLELGATQDRIVFSHPTKLISHLKYAHENNINFTVYDSFDEIIKIKKHLPNANLLLRIICPAKKVIREMGKKFGCDPKIDAKRLIQQTKEAGLNLIGFTFHVGSVCQENEVFDRALKICKELIDYARTIGYKCNVVNIGGGFQAGRETFDDVAAVINNAIDQYYSEDKDVSIISEPGRFFVAQSTKFACKINSKKIIYSENGDIMEILYFMSDGVYGPFSSHVYKKNSILVDQNPAKIIFRTKQTDSAKKYTSSLYGPTCDNFDLVYENILLPELQVEDWLIFNEMGAYTRAVSGTFNGFLIAPSFSYIDEKTWAEVQDISSKSSQVKIN